MRALEANETFRPLDEGCSPVWGFIVKGSSGDSVLQIRIKGAWEDVSTFSTSDTFLEELRRDAYYRIPTINATDIFII